MQRDIAQRAQQEFKPAWEELPLESNKQSEDEDRVVTYRRVTYGPLNDPPGDLGQDGDVEIDSRKFHRSANILVPGDHGKAMEINAVLDSEAGITCISEKLATRLSQHFAGMQVTFPFHRRHYATVADGRKVAMIERTGRVQVTLNAPRAPVVIGLVLAAIPGDDDVLIVRNKTMKDRLGIDVMACLNRTAITG